MNTALWVVACIAAAVFLIAGSTKLFIPRERLAEAPGGDWVWDFSARFVKVLGALEIAGVIGLILPQLLGIAPVLTPLAAVGLALVMVGAIIVESQRNAFKHVLVDAMYLGLTAFVAFGRFFTG